MLLFIESHLGEKRSTRLFDDTTAAKLRLLFHFVLLICVVASDITAVGASPTDDAARDGDKTSENESRHYVLPGTRVDSIHSTIVGVDYKLYISLPRDYEKQTNSYPVVVLLDADYTFSLLQNIVWFLADENELRPIILVGIAYPGVAQEKHGALFKLNRTRDYTPTHVASGGYGAEFQKESGGADRFLDFIQKELLPQIEKNYRVKRDDRTLLGMSYGGLLASYCLWTRPDLFQRFIIISPSLWYDKHFLPALLDKQEFARKDLRARAFFSVGANETSAKGTEDMVQDLQLFVRKLAGRNYPRFNSKLWIAEAESHHSVLPGAAMRGIRWVFSRQ